MNSTPAVRHVILHFDRIENSNNKQQQQRRIESSFKYCHRCVLHVKSLKEHSTAHHPINEEENNLKRNHFNSPNDCKYIPKNQTHLHILF